jgi:hypothetical protein
MGFYLAFKGSIYVPVARYEYLSFRYVTVRSIWLSYISLWNKVPINLRLSQYDASTVRYVARSISVRMFDILHQMLKYQVRMISQVGRVA